MMLLRFKMEPVSRSSLVNYQSSSMQKEDPVTQYSPLCMLGNVSLYILHVRKQLGIIQNGKKCKNIRHPLVLGQGTV